MKKVITMSALFFALSAQASQSPVETYTYTVSSRHSVEMALADLAGVCRREAKDRGLSLTAITDIKIENTFPIFVTGTCEFSN